MMSTVLKAQSVHPKPVFMHNLTPKPVCEEQTMADQIWNALFRKKERLEMLFIEVTCLMDLDKNGLACNHMIMYEYSSGDT